MPLLQELLKNFSDEQYQILNDIKFEIIHNAHQSIYPNPTMG